MPLKNSGMHWLIGTGCCVVLHLSYGILIRRLQYPKNQVSKKKTHLCTTIQLFQCKFYHGFILPNKIYIKQKYVINPSSLVLSQLTFFMETPHNVLIVQETELMVVVSFIFHYLQSLSILQVQAIALYLDAALMTRVHKICLLPWFHQYHRPCKRDTLISIYLSLLMEKGACVWIGCKLGPESLEVLGLPLCRSWRTH